MNNVLINNWNSVVGPNDLVYHLGDFCFGREDYYFDSVFSQLNGHIVFIEGNHDKLARKNYKKFYNYHEGYLEVYVGDQLFILSHYPMVVWNKKHRGSIMLHGHTHYNLPITRKDNSSLGKILDVGVDGNNYKPYSTEDIMAIMKNRPLISENPLLSDHHGNKSEIT